jgi:mRNA interferase RelE/StbE
VILKPAAKRSLDALSGKDFQRVKAHLLALGNDPRPAGAKKLKGSDGFWRVRVGDYRIIYQIEDDRLVVLVIGIAHRREAYR